MTKNMERAEELRRKVAFQCCDDEKNQVIEEFRQEVISEERERCAHVVETWAKDNETIQPDYINYAMIATVIREGVTDGD